NGVAEEVGGDVFAAKARRKRIALIDNAADGHVPAAKVAVRYVVEIAESVGVVQRSVLAERFPVIAALDAVQHVKAAQVGAVEKLTCGVEIESPRIAAAFAEKLEALGGIVVTPDPLLKLDAANVRRDGASLTAVEPAVRSPGKRIRDRVG